jgi:hypothetical protein
LILGDRQRCAKQDGGEKVCGQFLGEPGMIHGVPL